MKSIYWPGAEKILAFVAVNRNSEQAAALFLDRYRLRRVAVAAGRLAPGFARAGDDMRVDALFLVPGGLPRHLLNVWYG